MARKLNYQEFEGDMAKSQLQKIEMYAKKLNEMINPEDELEGWVQSKLSRISTDIGDIKHYLDYELKKMGHGGTTHIASLQPYLVMAKTDLDNDDVKSFKVYADDDEHAVEITEYMYKPYYDDFEVIKVQKFAEGGMVSTSKMQQAKKLLGESLWERFREDEKENVTIYLMNKGLIDIDDDDDDDDDDELMGMQDVPEDRTMWEYGYKRGGKVKMADGGYDNYEMVIISKGLEKDGGQYIKDRFLVSAKDIEEAKKIATEMWEKEMGNSDFHIVKVYID
jgi:hypothetical protein